VSDVDPAPAMTAAGLQALDADDWARLLPLARRALGELESGGDGAAARRLRALPTGRLVAGRSRAELCRLLVADERRRARLTELLDEAGLRDELAPRLAGAPSPPAPDTARHRRTAERDAEARRAREQQRLRRLREERDQARRQVEGARARAEAAEREAADARAEAAELQEELQRARDELGRTGEERRRAVERERRRGEARARELREQLREARRELEQAAERARQEERRPRARPAPASASPSEAPDRVVPGRPSRLPETVAWDTAEAVDLLLDAGRLVLVDGYNVTKQHRGALDLESQRDWLVRRLATLAAQRRVRPVVVFDGERGSSSRPAAGVREVQVRFTAAGITADDELVFAVEALPDDEPVVVVTDDRELTARLRVLDADVVGTGPFVWATPG
jgi:hypothetical protein